MAPQMAVLVQQVRDAVQCALRPATCTCSAGAPRISRESSAPFVMDSMVIAKQRSNNSKTSSEGRGARSQVEIKDSLIVETHDPVIWRERKHNKEADYLAKAGGRKTT